MIVFWETEKKMNADFAFKISSEIKCVLGSGNNAVPPSFMVTFSKFYFHGENNMNAISMF